MKGRPKNATISVAERLERYSIPEPNSGCRLWMGSVDSSGHGQLSIGGGRKTSAHRASWEQKNGPIPAGMQICHKCDVRSCIEETHLFLGTQADNMADMIAKGRARHRSLPGENHGCAKLSEAQAIEVIFAVGTHREIAARFRIRPSTVGNIKSGKKWRHLDFLRRVVAPASPSSRGGSIPAEGTP